jgi:hypothetical protein
MITFYKYKHESTKESREESKQQAIDLTIKCREDSKKSK